LAHSDLKRVVVAGGTGLVGRALTRALVDQGVVVTVLTRNSTRTDLPAGAFARDWTDLAATLEGADAVINLAGEGIADRRWTAARKAALRDSRVLSTRRLVEAMKARASPPKAFVSASAIGLYGARGLDPVDEFSPAGHGFLPDVCRAWEAEAEAAATTTTTTTTTTTATTATTGVIGIRVVRVRIGVVLAREGGALPKMALPVRLFQGSRLGSGAQGLSWIHLEDLVALLIEAARNDAWDGPFNATAPGPLSQEAFTRLLASRLHRPVLPLPAFLTAGVLRLMLGEMAEALLLQGAFVHPVRAQKLGFTFRFPTAREALEDLL